MNNADLFKAAHVQARATVNAVGNYHIAFTLALRELLAVQDAVEAVEKSDVNTRVAIMAAIDVYKGVNNRDAMSWSVATMQAIGKELFGSLARYAHVLGSLLLVLKRAV